MKAVIPAAGLGTRFLPLTKEQPKEMLPVVDRLAIHWVVEDAIAAGVRDLLIITGRVLRGTARAHTGEGGSLTEGSGSYLRLYGMP